MTRLINPSPAPADDPAPILDPDAHLAGTAKPVPKPRPMTALIQKEYTLGKKRNLGPYKIVLMPGLGKFVWLYVNSHEDIIAPVHVIKDPEDTSGSVEKSGHHIIAIERKCCTLLSPEETRRHREAVASAKSVQLIPT